MGRATVHLGEEHRIIEKALRVLETLTQENAGEKLFPIEKWKSCLCFFRLIADRCHHAKEEKVLLPALLQLDTLLGGGPQCTLFKELHMMLPSYIQQVDAINQEHGLKTKTSFGLDYGNVTNPVLEEHIIGRTYLGWMQKGVDAIHTDPSVATENLLMRDTRGYLFLLKGHIQKEDQCLFVMADELLNQQKQNTLYEQMLLMERESVEPNLKKDLITEIQKYHHEYFGWS